MDVHVRYLQRLEFEALEDAGEDDELEADGPDVQPLIVRVLAQLLPYPVVLQPHCNGNHGNVCHYCHIKCNSNRGNAYNSVLTVTATKVACMHVTLCKTSSN